jgi:hypothetical protein
MYRGFNLKLDEDYFLKQNIFSTQEINEYEKLGLSSLKNNDFLLKYIEEAEELEGDRIMQECFPNDIKEYNIFLSHSHKDMRIALIIAGLLKSKYKIEVFIDSTVWLNYIDLLKCIDDYYCKSKEKIKKRYDYNSKEYYDYDIRNYSTSHINLMLMNSLNMMIDKCEVLFFLNTPNSISIDNIGQKTNSPWIFSEIQTSKIIRKKIPNRNIPLMESTKYFSTDLKIIYPLELDHLTNISRYNFLKWINGNYNNPNSALDGLYEIYPLEKHSNINRF